MQASDYQQLKQDISIPRLSSYQHFFKTKQIIEIYDYYCWNAEISSAFFQLIGIVEITLRNKVHQALSSHCHNPQSQGSVSSNDWYNFLDLNKHSKDKILSVTHKKKKGTWLPKNPPLSHDDAISRMTYGFWPKILDIQKDINGNQVPWGEIIPLIIPNHRYKTESYWKKIKHQDQLYSRLEQIGSLRNRIAHFEPIWKQGCLFEETRERQNKIPKLISHAPVSPDEARNRLKLTHERILELLDWLSPARLKSYKQSHTYHKLNWLLSNDGMSLKTPTKITSTSFKRNLRSILKNKETISIHQDGIVSAILYSSN